MTGPLVVDFAWAVMNGGIAGLLVVGIWRNRRRHRRARAEVDAVRRRLENPPLPPSFRESLADWAEDAAGFSQGEMFLARMLADDLRKTLELPDTVIAAVLHETLVMAGRVALYPDHVGRFALLLRTMTGAAVELTALERETAAP